MRSDSKMTAEVLGARRPLPSWTAAVCAGFALLALFVGGAQAQVITEFGSGITAGAGVYGITTGPDGNLWFTEFAGNRIGRLNPATGAVTEFSNGITAGAQPDDITAGPDGNLWFTERKGNRIGKINPATGVVTEYSVGISPNAGLSGIAAGPDGNLWFTEPYGNYRKIGKINPTTGVITEYTSGINSALLDVTAGPDGNLWFTQDLVNHIGKINPATALVTEYSSGVSAAADTWGIAAGPDGNLWFTEANDNQIGKINPTTGVITEYSNGITHGASPLWIAAGPDGNLWFTESSGNRIGRITPAGVVTEFSAGITAGAVLAHITAGPDGNLWFTENASDRIGRITVVLSPSSLENPQPDSFQSGIGLISGWSCQGPSITVSIDGHSPVPVSYGAPRIDTASVCGAGNTNTGFGLLLNFNTLGNGLHSAQLYVNGSARGNAVQFTGVAPAGEFLAGVSKQVAVQDFPTTGKTTALTWQQSQQNFAIAGVAAKALVSLSLETGTTASLENPQPGSFQSGIGLLSGWSCQGPTISMAIDGAPPLGVPYGSARIDTAGVCGAADTNTGFGLLINFNTLGAGTHSAQLLVNGAAQGSPIPFTVTVPAGEFLSGASKQVQVNDFPRTGATTTLTWQQAQQNFAIQAVGP